MPSRVGHGPFLKGYWPMWPYSYLLYESRPDLLRGKAGPREWVQLKSTWRFVQALFCYVGPPDHVLYNIQFQLYGVILVALLIQTDWANEIVSDLSVRSLADKAFRYSSFTMSLLLAFRINKAYERWKEALNNVATMARLTSNIFQQVCLWVKDPIYIDSFRRYCLVWLYASKQVLEGRNSLEPIAEDLLHPEELKLYMESRKGRQVIVMLLRQLANQAVKREVLTSSEYAAIEFNIRDALKYASDAIRMKSQPAPYGLYLICSGFVQIWCFLLPTSLVYLSTESFVTWGAYFNSLDVSGLVACVLVAVMLLGCDQIASQFDDPYDMMPLDDIFGTYADDINRTEKDAKGALEAVERAFNVKESEDLGAVAKDDMTPYQPAVCCDIPVAEAPALSQHKWSTLHTYTDTVSVDNPDVQGILVPTNSGSDNQLLPSGVPTSASLNSGQAQPVLNAVLQPIAEGGRTLNRQWKSIAQAQSEASEPPYAAPPAVQKL